jgi:hypothetical protein
MPSATDERRRRANIGGHARAIAAAVLCLLPAVAAAQTPDVVEVASGDRVRGDITRLQRGQLEFRTISAGAGHQRFAGTIFILWPEVASLTSDKTLNVETASGERFTGTISSPSAGRLIVQTQAGPSRILEVREVVGIIPVESGFHGRTTGSIDFGVDFANTDNAWTYTLDAEALHRSSTHAYETQISFSSWLSARDDTDRLSRNDLKADVRRRLSNRWFGLATGALQQDEPLELHVRLLLGGGVGRRLVQSTATVFSVEGGLDYVGEDYHSGKPFDHSLEAFGGLHWDYFPAGSNLAASVDGKTYISLARQRARLQIDGTLRHDLFWNMYWAFNAHERFDSDPPDDRPRSGLGLSFALGWTF